MKNAIRIKPGNVVFVNNPFEVMRRAFKQLYPKVPVRIHFRELERDLGLAELQPGQKVPHIYVDPRQTFAEVLKTLAHELAHVAVPTDAKHGKRWRAAFKAIRSECQRIVGRS